MRRPRIAAGQNEARGSRPQKRSVTSVPNNSDYEFHESLLSRIVESAMWRDTVAALMLSVREDQVVKCILTSDANESTIGDRLGISAHTVHTHLERCTETSRQESLSIGYSSVDVLYQHHGVS